MLHLVYLSALLFIQSYVDLNSNLQKEIVQVQTNEIKLTKGKKKMLSIEIMVKDGYHIQANKVNDESLIPAALEITPMPQVITGVPLFPRYKLFRLEGTEDDLNVFDGKFIIEIPVKTTPVSPAGKYTMKAAFRYQACDSKTCLFPRTINFEIAVIVK